MDNLIAINNNKHNDDTSSDSSYMDESDENITIVVDIQSPTIDLKEFFTNKELCHFKSVNNYFKILDEEKIRRMLQIINGEADVSLRVMDWYITRYSRKAADMDGFVFNPNASIASEDTFDIHINYKAQLKSYRKRYFDPFKRGKKFVYQYRSNDTSKRFITTLGQLLFFKWAIQHNIVDYVIDNSKTIVDAMVKAAQEEKAARKRKAKKAKQMRAAKKAAQAQKLANKQAAIASAPINVAHPTNTTMEPIIKIKPMKDMKINQPVQSTGISKNINTNIIPDIKIMKPKQIEYNDDIFVCFD